MFFTVAMSKRLADLLDLLSDDRRSLPARIGALARAALLRDGRS